jgi:S1-C subfamily serine protease
MRRCVLGIVCVLALGTMVHAEDAPKGMIGIMIKVDEENKDGKIVIDGVISDSPAEKAGFKMGDVIIKVNDKAAENLEDTVKEIIKQEPGTKIKIVIKREGKEKTIEVEVGKRRDT